MTLGALLTVLDESGLRVRPAAPGNGAAVPDTTVGSIAYDSRTVSPSALFVALKGAQADGAAFAGQAIAKGAAAVVAETGAPEGCPVPWITVSDGRLALALLASHVHGHPSRRMRVVGITGTNGKTTTSFLVQAAIEAAGIPCGLMGTVQYRVGGDVRDAARTTPEAPDVQRMLREMLDAGCGACAMEVSSHALALKRVDGTRFAAAVFTNLTRDHLDYHDDMERYFAAKRRLFELLPDGAPAVVNADDRRGAVLAAELPRCLTYAVDRPADVTPESLPTFAHGPVLRRAHAGGPRACPVAAGRPVQRVQPPRGGGDGRGARTAGAGDRVGTRGRRVGAGPFPDRVPARRRRHGHCRLRPHRRRAEEPARGGAADRRRAPHHRVRLRRRPRPEQAPADGRGRRAPERHGGTHLGQPALRGSRARHRRNRTRLRAAAGSRPACRGRGIDDERRVALVAAGGSPRGYRPGHRRGRPWRRRGRRREGSREVPGHPQSRAPVRRCERGPCTRSSGGACGEAS